MATVKTTEQNKMKFTPEDGQEYVVINFDKPSLWTLRTFRTGEPASELHAKVGICYEPSDEGRSEAFWDAQAMLGIDSE